ACPGSARAGLPSQVPDPGRRGRGGRPRPGRARRCRRRPGRGARKAPRLRIQGAREAGRSARRRRPPRLLCGEERRRAPRARKAVEADDGPPRPVAQGARADGRRVRDGGAGAEAAAPGGELTMPARSDLLYTPVRELARLLRAHQTTSLELTELALTRLSTI